MSDVFPYVSARAFDAALTDRLRTLSSRGPYTIQQLVAPDPTWEIGYAKAAAQVRALPERTLGEALLVAKRMVDPVLAGEVAGQRWSPEDLAWVPPA